MLLKPLAILVIGEGIALALLWSVARDVRADINASVRALTSAIKRRIG